MAYDLFQKNTWGSPLPQPRDPRPSTSFLGRCRSFVDLGVHGSGVLASWRDSGVILRRISHVFLKQKLGLKTVGIFFLNLRPYFSDVLKQDIHSAHFFCGKLGGWKYLLKKRVIKTGREMPEVFASWNFSLEALYCQEASVKASCAVIFHPIVVDPRSGELGWDRASTVSLKFLVGFHESLV